MSNASWVPDEPSSTLYDEKTWLQGAILTGVGYGINVTLFVQCFHALLAKRPGAEGARKRAFYLAYISAMFVLASLFVGACSEMTQLSFIQYRNIPGGPSMYENVEFSIPADEAGNVSFVLTNWFADALMVWRCSVIYRGGRFPPWLAIAFPCLMYAAEIVIGLLFLIQVSAPSGSPYLTGAAGAINWTLPYLCIAVSLNVIVTIMIVARLLLYRYRISRVLGPRHGSHYTGIAAMIVESAALYSAFALLLIIPFGMNNSLANVFLQSLSQVQVIAPLLIIYRVAQGKSWTENTSLTMNGKDKASSTMIFMRNVTGADEDSRKPAVHSSSMPEQSASESGGDLEFKVAAV
ncbi:uncharacterized protein FIBRA_08408 [Fibroporia radiculosa]|uniref:G-protein coupled receptors family 1 profile domain-containing protein n=1 Tax=Fibroporia radiculosa TaxID=599839 RepID=J4I2P9_9APHY|nr:uncharacterized protein FIBRA_08408 [Fibroporia radiculosa]CCM06167.1 predicted protein [Fibroporia radiculosa]